jgi:NSS family neurotransmitter:Na+ symporter
MSDTTVVDPAGGDSGRQGGRERWDSRTAFIMASIGSAVGLGNVWRFPAVAYENGGGAFFIPYFVALLTAGIPLLILEFSIGQMMQSSAPGSLKKLNRNFEWVGWFALLVGTVISIYYAAIMAYSWNYAWFSLSATPPWSAGGSGTEGEFFFDRFLQFGTGSGGLLSFRWPIIAGLALTWVSVFLIIYKGVHRVGKIVMITVPLPWIILLILAIRGLTLDGASAGIEYYLRPDFEALKRPSTWLAAYGQIFFSLTLGFGVMIAYASYRPRHSDVTNNAFITSFANCLTSFFAGFAVFSVLGFLAFKNGVPVESVVKGGPSLAFVTYPAAITKMGDLGWIWPPLIGFLFFIALLTLGIDSLFSLVEAIGAGFHERFPKLKRVYLAAAMCGFCFIVGVFTMGTKAGLGWVDVLDYWTNKYGLVIVGLLQCLLVGYFFSTHRIRDFADDVSEVKLGGWWELCIKVITPVVLVYLLSNEIIKEFATPYGESDYAPFLVWTARVVFVALFAAAFAMTRRWSHLAVAGGALVVGLVFFGLVRPATVTAEVECAAIRGGNPREVKFTANVSGARAPYLAQWDFGDGRTSKDLNPTHTYDAVGTYAAVLQVRGEDGRGSAAKSEVDVQARPFDIEKALVEPRRSLQDSPGPLAHRCAATAAWGTPPYRYRWEFGDGDTSTEASCEHAFPKPGDYTVTVTATDANALEAKREIPVHVPPFAVSLAADPRGGEVPAMVSFKAELTSPEGTAVKPEGYDFRWDFGDSLGTDGGAGVQHRYDLGAEDLAALEEENATYTTRSASVTVVRASDGQSVTETIEISLRPPEEHAPGKAAFLGAFGAALLVGGLVFSIMLAVRHHRAGPPESESEAGG